MGWVGCYDAIAYCDSCKKEDQVVQVETVEECRQILRDAGWKFRKDGTILCSGCADKPSVKILPEEKREGSDWRARWPKYERRN